MRHDVENLLTILQRPHISEKTVSSASGKGLYVFKVLVKANKLDVKTAVEKMFGKPVLKVNIVNVKRKPSKKGYHRSWKKAYVTFSEDTQIDFDTLKLQSFS